ncbi:MAG: RNA polymerase sigma factor [Rhodobacteraceae bacterium]|nr:RNA polymerase sigma factor [Paracoccaceae bacterium]
MRPEPLDDPDAALLDAYASGQKEAAQALTERLAPRCFSQAFRMMQNQAEAEEIAQEAMLRLWRAAPGWRYGEAKVSTWLYRVVANLCTDRLRKRRRTEPLSEVAEPADPAPSAAAGLQEKARMSALTGALAQLPTRQAEAVALRHLEGLSNPQIGQVMELSVEAVESLTARGKRALAKLLAPRRAELGWNDD